MNLDKVVKDIMAFSKRRDYVLNCIKMDMLGKHGSKF